MIGNLIPRAHAGMAQGLGERGGVGVPILSLRDVHCPRQVAHVRPVSRISAARGPSPGSTEQYIKREQNNRGANRDFPPRQNSVGFGYPEAKFKRGALLRAASSMIRRSRSALTMRRSA